MTQDEYMKEALRLAAEAEEAGETPIGAVVVRERDGAIVGRGRNRREADKNALAHAEIEAIRDACQTLGGWRLSGCTLYVTLEPCPMCAGAIVNARLDRVVYGAADPKAGACGSLTDLFSLPLNHHPVCEHGVMETECGDILRRFFKGLRDKKE
ncbi:MAG: nucleoside deaminase [Clostridia bacterium]|nr:nucleoside deaminase [Clostridia bacterium]